MQVHMTIFHKTLAVDTEKLHDTWITKCLEYGIRRYINDTFSQEKGDAKYDACTSLIKEMEAGGEYVARRGNGRQSLDPITALAVRNAKADLTAMFRAITQQTKAVDMAKHEKVAPFFTISDDSVIWKTAAVMQWMANQAKAGKRNYKEDAEATLSPAELGLDLDLALENDTDPETND